MNLRELKQFIRAGGLEKVRGAVDGNPDLLHIVMSLPSAPHHER